MAKTRRDRCSPTAIERMAKKAVQTLSRKSVRKRFLASTKARKSVAQIKQQEREWLYELYSSPAGNVGDSQANGLKE